MADYLDKEVRNLIEEGYEKFYIYPFGKIGIQIKEILVESVAECGVYRGDFAKYINMVFPDRNLYFFDSFEGFDSQTVVGNSDNFAQTDKWINTLKDTSVDIVMKKMKFPENIIVKKSFIPESLGV